jgi:hypothetical protein
MVTRPTLAWLLILMTYASSALINKLFRPGAVAREQRGRGTEISTSGNSVGNAILPFFENYAVMIRPCFLDGNF